MKEVIPAYINSIMSTKVELNVVDSATLRGRMPDIKKSAALEIEQVQRLMDALDEIDSLVQKLDSVGRELDLENFAGLRPGAINEGNLFQKKRHTKPRS